LVTLRPFLDVYVGGRSGDPDRIHTGEVERFNEKLAHRSSADSNGGWGLTSRRKAVAVIRLDPQLAARVRLGVIQANSVVMRADAAAVWAEVERVAGDYRRRFAGKTPSDIPDLQPARELYRRTGEDPTKLRPSSEALLRRVLRGDSLYRINSLVDTCNLCSLEFLLPIGLYDLDRISDEVTARIGQDGEGYESLGKGFYSVEGRLALFDESGPFGSPTNDSRRTAITDTTRRCLMVIFAPGTYAVDRLSAHVLHAASRLKEFVGAGAVNTTVVPT